MNIKKLILNNKLFAPVAISVHRLTGEIQLYHSTKQRLNSAKSGSEKKIFYIGIPAHANLGDLAQGVCIRRWIRKNYPGRKVVEIETNALVNTHFSLLEQLKASYSPDDFIVFQSGYTTTDLGGYADEMHRAVMKTLPNAKILMLPQTIFFKDEDNRRITSAVYNSQRNMLFLARDKVSYNMALQMFPDISVKLYPDIVTTLIGNYDFSNSRDGIIFCLRDDGEKYYSDEELEVLIEKCRKIASVNRTDTTKNNTKNVVCNAEQFINSEIETYSKYRVMITDRYHGTILSLVAGTPVIIIRTTDHKVTTGADWFKGVYDEYVYLADDLEEAYQIAERIYQRFDYKKLIPYFEEKYYDKLPRLFEENRGVNSDANDL